MESVEWSCSRDVTETRGTFDGSSSSVDGAPTGTDEIEVISHLEGWSTATRAHHVSGETGNDHEAETEQVRSRGALSTGRFVEF